MQNSHEYNTNTKLFKDIKKHINSITAKFYCVYCTWYFKQNIGLTINIIFQKLHFYFYSVYQTKYRIN